MSQIFHPSMNTVARATIFGAVFIAAAAGWIGWQVDRSPYITNAGVPRAQPVPFSHEHHVSGLGIDCRYCHLGHAERIRRHPADKDVHDLSLADLDQRGDARAGPRQLER